MLRVAICDDDIHICSEIEKVIMDYANTSPYNIGIEIFISGEELIRFIQKEHTFVRCIELALKISEKEKKVFKYQVGHEFKQATINEIMYFENSLRKVSVIMCDEMDEFYGSLKSIKKQLPNTFISPHASYLVNYNYIERISKETIFMKNGAAIPISKRKLKEIHNLQIQFIKEIRDVNL